MHQIILLYGIIIYIMAFLGSLLSAGLPLLGNLVKSVAPGLISKVSNILPDALKPIVNSVVPGLINSGVDSITSAVENRGSKSAGDVLRDAGKGFLSSAVKSTSQSLQNINNATEGERSINNHLPVYVKADNDKGDKKDKNIPDKYERERMKSYIKKKIAFMRKNGFNGEQVDDVARDYKIEKDASFPEDYDSKKMNKWYAEAFEKKWFSMIDDTSRDIRKAYELIKRDIETLESEI